MQLFHIDHTLHNGDIIITDEETINQCRKVLRLKVGDLIHVQSTMGNTTTRHLTKIKELSTKLIGNIIETNTKSRPQTTLGMLIAMSNKWDKIELITQKLAEIGLHQITFRPSERSVIKDRNKTKASRLQKILKEATEQSRSRFLPELGFREHPEDLLENTKLVIFDTIDTAPLLVKALVPLEGRGVGGGFEASPARGGLEGSTSQIYGLIGPEGGLSPKDLARFAHFSPTIHSLGDSILRTETASIIGGRIIKNLGE